MEAWAQEGSVMRLAAVALLALLSGCATPVIMLKNETTGQVARCGGGTTGFMAGGMIGQSIEKDSDERCARDFEAQGFKRLR